MTDQSSITINSKGEATSYSGPDAVNYFRAKLLASSLGLFGHTGLMPTRGVGITRMLALAASYTGPKQYKGKPRAKALQAQADMQIWLDAMFASLPIERRD